MYSKSIRISLHLLVWGIIILFCNTLNWSWGGFTTEDKTLLLPSIYGSVFNALIFYIHAYWLIPSKFPKLEYWVWGFFIFFGFSFVENTIDYFYTDYLYPDKYSFISILISLSFNTLPLHLLYWILAFAYRYPKEIIKNERQKQQLIKERYTAELKYLKTQINPHFLFNGINSVYHLVDKDKELAKQTLLKFSGLLRYQLYECNEAFIPIRKELEYLENYIMMEQIRKGNDAKINWQINAIDQQAKIAPLLMTPFIENGFKYLSNFENSEANFLNIDLLIQDGKLELIVENSIDDLEESSVPQKTSGGVGLSNVQQRLKLIYPDKHDLVLKKMKDKFLVALKIDLI